MSDLDIPEFLKRDASWKDFPVTDQSRVTAPVSSGTAGLPMQVRMAEQRVQLPRPGPKRFPTEKFEARKALAEGARWDARNNKWVHDLKPVYAHAESVKIDGKNWFAWAR